MDWRPYITLSPDFSAQERADITRALDFIANAHDGEGMALLQAAANQRGEPVLIGPLNMESSLIKREVAVHYAGVIALDMDTIRSMGVWDRDGEAQPMSLNAVLVHELFHAAQPEASARRLYKELITNTLQKIPEAQRAQVNGELQQFFGEIVDHITAQMLKPGFSARMFANELDIEKYPSLVSHSDILDPLFMEIGDQIASDLLISSEEEATRFTDAFMQKNAGPREPWRGTYENATDSGEDLDTVRVLNRRPGEFYPTLGFERAGDPAAVPRVAPVGAEAFIREALQGCPAIIETSFDLQQVEGSQLGTLAPPVALPVAPEERSESTPCTPRR